MSRFSSYSGCSENELDYFLKKCIHRVDYREFYEKMSRSMFDERFKGDIFHCDVFVIAFSEIEDAILFKMLIS